MPGHTGDLTQLKEDLTEVREDLSEVREDPIAVKATLTEHVRSWTNCSRYCVMGASWSTPGASRPNFDGV